MNQQRTPNDYQGERIIKQKDFWQEIRNICESIQEQTKEKRLKQGLTQRELAKKANLSQGTITRAERNGCVSLDAYIRISIALEKPIIINNKITI